MTNVLNFVFREHFAFIILISSAVGYYFFNVWLKFVLSQTEYGQYALLNSFVTVAMSFALIGGDQVVMRTAKKEGQNLHLSKKVMVANFGLLFLFAIISPLIVFYWFDNTLNAWLLTAVCILSGFSLLMFSIFRVSRNFTKAQIQKNLWKLLIFLGCFIIFSIVGHLTINVILIILIFSIIGCIVLSYGSLMKIKINLDNKIPFDFGLWVGFAISMFSMSLITNADRFLVNNFVGVKEVGGYFFLQNIFLFPLSQIQLYSGFRELSSFKEKFNSHLLKKSIKRNFLLAITISIILFGGILILQKAASEYFVINWQEESYVILFLVIGGIIRVVYSVLSAAMGAVGDTQSIKYTNLYTLAFCLFSFAIFWFIGFSLSSIAILFCLVWGFRTLIYYFYLLRL